MNFSPKFKNNNSFQIVIGSLFLLVSFLGAYLASATLRKHDEARFLHAQKQVIQEIESRMETYINALKQTRSMFYVTREVDREEFKQYIAQLEILKKYPGIQGIGLTERLSPNKLASHEKEIRKDLPSYSVWPPTPRKEYFSIVYLEPLDWRNRRAIGYDMFTHPVRRAAMKKARDSGMPAMSGAVELVQETNEDRQVGFLIYVPFYKKDAPINSLEERRENLIGFIYSPFRTKDLFGQIMEPLKELAVDVEILFATTNSSTVLFDRYPDFSLEKSNFSTEISLTFAQMPWKIRIHAMPSFQNSTTIYLPFSILTLGCLLSIFITGFLSKKSKHARLMEERSSFLEKINSAARSLSSELNLEDLLQTLTDVGRDLSVAKFGAFFYNTINDQGEAYVLYTVSGVPKEEFLKFPMPRNTEVFAPTFNGESVISPDITKDSRYGKNFPYNGIPEGHLPVCSYLAVAVKSRTGEVIGGLFYGHDEPGKFSDHERQLIEGLAPQAAIAIDNARLYEEAKKAIATREEFLSIASHELKTPITSMQLQFQAAAKMIAGKNKMVYQADMVEKRVTTAIRQLSRMTKLIEDMLDSSRIAMNKFQLNRQSFDLAKLMSEILDRYMEQFKATDIVLNVTIPENLPFIVNGDEYRIEQVITNLINNAIKYGAKKPLSISLAQIGIDAVIKVEDQGIGIPKESLKHIFKRYERVDSTKNLGGLGLGLYISKRIIESHHGKIEVESDLGVRTTFTVTIPMEDQSNIEE